MSALDVRMVAAEVQANVAALKTAVDALSTSVDAINTVTSAWVVNALDAALPEDTAVKTQLAAYDALNTTITKPGNSLNDSLAVIRAAE